MEPKTHIVEWRDDVTRQTCGIVRFACGHERVLSLDEIVDVKRRREDTESYVRSLRCPLVHGSSDAQ